MTRFVCTCILHCIYLTSGKKIKQIYSCSFVRRPLLAPACTDNLLLLLQVTHFFSRKKSFLFAIISKNKKNERLFIIRRKPLDNVIFEKNISMGFNFFIYKFINQKRDAECFPQQKSAR